MIDRYTHMYRSSSIHPGLSDNFAIITLDNDDDDDDDVVVLSYFFII